MNQMELSFNARIENEPFARTSVASFITSLNPTIDELVEIKTIISEGVSNAIIHGYEGAVKKIVIRCRILEQTIEIEVEDQGVGIEDVPKAMEPLFTTKGDCERAGMGFSFMEAFMDTLEVISAPGQGPRVKMTKKILHTENRYER